MGASTFEVYQQGADAQEAFTKAREQAAFEHGHSGYTGTLAEKYDFTIARPTTLTYSGAQTVAAALVNTEDYWDKWGPAGALRVVDQDHDGWLFFGWASS
jgi:hypothetical protein